MLPGQVPLPVVGGPPRPLPVYAGMPSSASASLPPFYLFTSGVPVASPRLATFDGNTDFNVWPGILQGYINQLNAVIDDSAAFSSGTFAGLRNFHGLGDRLYYNAAWCLAFACSMLLPSLKSFKTIFRDTAAYNRTIGVPQGGVLVKNIQAVLMRLSVIFMDADWDGLSYTYLQQQYCQTWFQINDTWRTQFWFTQTCDNSTVIPLPTFTGANPVVGNRWRFSFDPSGTSPALINPIPSDPKTYPGVFPTRP